MKKTKREDGQKRKKAEREMIERWMKGAVTIGKPENRRLARAAEEGGVQAQRRELRAIGREQAQERARKKPKKGR